VAVGSEGGVIVDPASGYGSVISAVDSKLGSQLPPTGASGDVNAVTATPPPAINEPAMSHPNHAPSNVGGKSMEAASHDDKTGERPRVRRSFDSDDSRGREIKSKPGAVLAGGKRPPWMKRERPGGKGDREGPLTLIGGKPIPVNVLEHSGPGGRDEDRPSYVGVESWPEHLGGGPRGDPPVYQQVPEPSGAMWVGLGALLLGRRRRSRR
jgi:hypothetical protein